MRNIIEKFKSLGKTYQYFIVIFVLYFIFIVLPNLLLSFGGGINELIAEFPILILLSLFIYPIYFVIRDERIDKEKKIGWLLLVFFFNWLAFAFYLIKKKD